MADLIFHTHRYVVRLSAFSDVSRLIRYLVTVSLFLLLLSVSCEIITGVRYFKIWNIFTMVICSFSLMTIMRLAIKSLYTVIQENGSDKRRRIIVLGTSLNSLVLAGALKDEIDGKYEPVALMSINGSTKTTINGLPVVNYDKNRIDAIFRKYGANTLMFSSSQIEIIRQWLADDFLAHSIRLIMINSMEDYTSNAGSGNLSAHVEDIKIEDLLGREPINTGNPMVSRTFSHQVVMVTGAAGSIGSEIVNQLAKFQAREIVLVDQAETPMHELQLRMQEKYPDIKIHLFIGDIVNRERMEQAFLKYRPRYVFHAAAYKHVPMMEINPSEAVCTNVFGTKNISDLL